ncbi:MAG: VCBS repeat-containing protein [Planctomycetes bacterium]|nr:VCBS repeat-containing protein [Planctomycetota bacterium]MCC7171549.1 VCBS repeat-containing protein [Planctomycetota bacterium]
MTRPVPGSRFALAALVLCGTASAQQLVQQAGVIAGPTSGAASYNEGVLSFDCDNDGDIDILLPAGDGFSGAGTAALPTLDINTVIVSGNPVFVNEAATRLPAINLIAKEAMAIDIENDGDDDLFIPQSFNRPPKLYLNNGSGFFSDVSAARLPAGNFNSYSSSAGDFDNDGDLDITMAHSGGTSQNGTGGQLQLWQNDGAGFFSNVTASKLPVIGKTGQMNVMFLDIDSDFDLDIVLDGKSTPQHVYLNNGAGTYSVVTNLIPAGTASTYETDWADLDGDTDIDGFYVHLSGSNEGTARNNLIESGTLSFTGSTATMLGGNGFDDNEVAFMDYDNDGDYDLMVGSLSSGRERMYQNNGNFTFTAQNVFSAQTDSTLDLTIADYDNDGDFDVVTAQGESGNFTDRYYRNAGPADSRAPTVVARKVSSADSVAPFVVLSRVTDATLDDGQQWIDATVNWTVTPLVGAPVVGSAPMKYSGGSTYRGVIDSGPMNDYRATVAWSVTAVDPAGNSVTSSTQNFIGCGKELYGVGAGGANVLTLDATGSPRIGSTFSIDVAGGQPNASGIMLLGVARVSTPFAGGTLLTLPVSVIGVPVGPAGSASYPAPIPDDVSLVGATVQLQVILADPSQSEGAALSNGLELTICPK